MKDTMVLISSAVMFNKAENGRYQWFLVKTGKDSDWEFPKTVVRKGESSVRAILRVLGEQSGMSVRILEEAGRSGGTTTVNNNVLPKRQLYYLMIFKGAGDIMGFEEFEWVDYAKAIARIKSKNEKDMLRSAKKGLDTWLKERLKRRKAKKLLSIG